MATKTGFIAADGKTLTSTQSIELRVLSLASMIPRRAVKKNPVP
jgi:hypothetical protein